VVVVVVVVGIICGHIAYAAVASANLICIAASLCA